MEGTLFTPARTVQDIQEIQVGAMATATIQMGGAKGRVQVSIVGGTMLIPAMIVGEIEECAMATATGHGTIRRLKGTAEGREVPLHHTFSRRDWQQPVSGEDLYPCCSSLPR